MKTILAWIGLICIGIAIHNTFFSNDHSAVQTETAGSDGPSDTTGAVAEKAPALPMEVSAPQLYADYERNEVAADETYKGKRVAVSGNVISVTKDGFDAMHVGLFVPGHALVGVDAEPLPGEAHDIAQLEKGQLVTMECTDSGFFLSSVMLKECRVEGDRPSSAQSEAPTQPAQPIQQPVAASACTGTWHKHVDGETPDACTYF